MHIVACVLLRIYIHKCLQMDGQMETDRQTVDGRMDGRTDRQTERLTDRLTDRQTEVHAYKYVQTTLVLQCVKISYACFLLYDKRKMILVCISISNYFYSL